MLNRFLSLARLLPLVLLLALVHAASSLPRIQQWDYFEVAVPGPSTGNPFTDVRFSATFTDGRGSVDVPGFYDGNGIYRVRFMPDRVGTWHYLTHSNCWPLTKKTGEFEVVPATGSNHGPVRVFATYHFAYADGTPYRELGTTTYNWFYQPDALQEQTVKTLAASPFNKDRMLLLPTNGLGHRPGILLPFVGTGPRHCDATRFNPEFFQRIEQRIRQLRDIGVQADVILFSPYSSRWGFDQMDAATDDRYVRYVVARLSAFRNVWWSLANEYDFIRTMRESDWDRLFQVVEHSDPYGHLRSIHNGARLYDYNKPWVTHVSLQNGSAVEEPGRAEIYRRTYEKPIVFDEVKYEGHSARRWGNLSAQEMVARFWFGTVAGTYVGHGETLRNAAGTAWLSGGGTLAGESPARIAFLKQILDDAPTTGIDPLGGEDDASIAGKGGEYYLVYFGRQAPATWRFHLPNNGGAAAGQHYRIEVLDTWGMTITPVPGTFTTKAQDKYTFVDGAGRSVALPGRPYMALRIRRVGQVENTDAAR